MATNIVVTDSIYLRELKNGKNFSLNTGDSSDHLLGHVGDRQQVKLTIQVSNTFRMGRYTIIGGNTIILRDGQSFLNEDFYAGGRAYLSLTGTGFNNWDFDIQSISTDGSELVATNIVEKDNSGVPTGPTILPDGEYGTGSGQDILRSLVQSEGLVCKFGFVSNDGNKTFISPLDGIEQAYKFSGIRTAAPSAVDGVWNSAVQGSNTGSMTCRFIQDVQDNGVIKSGVSTSTAKINSIQEFEIIQDFIIPEYLQGQFDNVVNQLPPEGFVDGLKQIFEFEFRLNLSNPNTSQFGEYNTVKGNVRYFNDNYISADQEYSISNVSLVDVATGQTISSVNASSTTRVTCKVTNPNNPFVDGDPVLLEHSYLPNGDQYTGRTETYSEVWIRNTARSLMSAAPVGVTDGVINNFEATFVNAGQVDLQFDLIFTVAQQAQLQAGYNYLLAVNVADDTLAIEVSDTTKLVIQADQYTLNTDIAGLANFPQSYVYTRPMMFPIVDPADRFTSLRGWIQDGFLYDWSINLDLVEEATLEAITLRLVAFNTLENTFFELDKYDYDLSGQVVTVGPPDVQNITVDNTRGYDLADGDKLNFAKLQTGTYSAPNQLYTGQTAFRLSWQDWIALPNADTVFYNPAELNNGLNKKCNRYSLQNNYVISVLIDARIGKVVDGVNVITQYINRSANLEVYDFGQQDGSPMTWTGNIQTFDELGADLGGTILTDGLTTIKGTFAPDSPVTNPSLYWGEVRLEPLNNPGDNYYSLSTIEAGIDNNPLQAPTGSTYAKIEIVSGNVVVSADVNADILPTGSSWNPTVRMGLIDQSIPIMPTIKIQIDGNTRQVHGDFIVFQQSEIMANAQFIDQIFTLSEAVTPGTPTGWQFKVSPENAQPGGDAYDKSNWSAISYISFTSLANDFLGQFSDRWVYIEADDSSKIDEGFIIEFERPEIPQPTNNLITTFANGGVDQDKIIYFDKNITVNTISLSTVDTDIYYAIRQGSPSTEDWTVFTRFTSVANLQADLDTVTDGDKYGLHFYIYGNSIDGATLTLNFDYNSSEDTAKTLSVSQSDVNLEYRSDLVNCIDWRPTSNTQYGITNASDTALLSKLDYTNAITVVGWYEQRTGGVNANSFPLLTPPQAGTGNTDAGGIGFFVRNDAQRINISMSGQTGGGGSTNRRTLFWNMNTFQGGLARDHRTMVVFTFTGTHTNLIDDWEAYVNGLKVPSNFKSIFANQPPVGPVEPSGGVYWHGRLQSSDGNPNKSERVEIYDGVMTAENIRILFNNPNAGRNGDVPNIFRSWDFGSTTGTTVPETVASQDITLTTSITPSSFY